MLNTILERKSVRKYTDQQIDAETIEKILRAGMSGPTAVNARPWSFIVLTEQEMLEKGDVLCIVEAMKNMNEIERK